MRQAGLSPVHDVFIACGWDLGKDSEWWPWRIVVPDDADPLYLDFNVCRGLQCIVAGSNIDRVSAVLFNVLAHYPTRLMCLDMTTSRLIPVYDAATRE